MSEIKAILFDADGVIQKPSTPLISLLGKLVSNVDEMEEFIEAVFAAEKPCLTGKGDFVTELSSVLAKWHCRVVVAKALKIWTMIEPDQEVLEMITKLKENFRVCLVSNQQQYRAEYMAFNLGYDKIFNDSFYSCQLGWAKPSKEYFIEVLKQLNLTGSSVLFLDDHEKNTQAAQSVGLHAEVFNLEEGTNRLKNLFTKYDINLK